MKKKLMAVLALTILCACNASLSTADAQGTAFTYQGQLSSGGSTANGFCDFQFALSNAPSGGSQIGGTVTNLAVEVSNGVFTTTVDFGGRLRRRPRLAGHRCAQQRRWQLHRH